MEKSEERNPKRSKKMEAEPGLVQGALLKQVVEATREVVGDVSIRWFTNNLTLRSKDSTKMALVSVFFSAKTFADYGCHRTISMTVCLNDIAKVLTRVADHDVLVTIMPHAHARFITFRFQSPVRVKEKDSVHPRVPDGPYHATVMMPSAEFAGIWRNFSCIGDTVTISVTTECLRFFTKGNNCTGDVTLKPGEAIVIFMKKSDSVCLSFSMRCWNSLAKATPLSSRVLITLSKELPIGVVEYRFAHPHMMDAVCFYLNPVPTIEPQDYVRC